MRRIPFLGAWVTVAVFFLVIAGCGGGKTPTKAKQRVAKPAAQAVESAPEAVTPPVKEESRYRFSQKGKRDPFIPFIAPIDETTKGKTPLERFDIYQLKLTGIIAGKEAMVLAPDGVVYYVGKGTPIGRHSGKIVRINRDEIVIREKFRDYRGEIQFREVSLGFVD